MTEERDTGDKGKIHVPGRMQQVSERFHHVTQNREQFMRGRWILCFPGSHGLPSPSLSGDPELHVDGAWGPGEILGSLF